MGKTEALTTARGPQEPIQVQEYDGFDAIKFVDTFEYRGVLFDTARVGDKAVRARVEKARKAFWSLANSVWNVRQISIATKIKVYRACVVSVLLYGAEVWTPSFAARGALEKFQMMCLRKISGFGTGTLGLQ